MLVGDGWDDGCGGVCMGGVDVWMVIMSFDY